MAYSSYCTQVNRHRCFSIGLSSAPLAQLDFREVEAEVENQVVRQMQMDSKSGRNDVYRARSCWEREAKRGCWLLL